MSIRTNNGTQNNFHKSSLGAANTPFIRLAPNRFEDGIQSPSGVAFDEAEGNPLIGIDNHPVGANRPPLLANLYPIFSAAEREGVKFLFGDERVSENDNLTAVQTRRIRNHNRIVHNLSKFLLHTVGFYQVGDRNGTVVYLITGKSLSSNQSEDYAKAAIGKSVAEFRVGLSSLLILFKLVAKMILRKITLKYFLVSLQLIKMD
ncbi:MAG: peroxidase family protein [Rhizonema sp. PD37]|nr:peroxidase family protein [Rhizonema sp. PD37]